MSLGDILLDRGKITEEHLEAALAARKGPEDRLDRILVRLGFVDECDVLAAVGEQLSIPVVDLATAEIDTELLRRMPAKLVHNRNLIPLKSNGSVVRVATADPFDLYALDELRMLIGRRVETVLAPEPDIQRVIKQHFGVGGHTIDEMIDDKDDVELLSDSVDETGDLIEMAQEATVVRLVNEILIEAVRDRASDIHVEPFENDLRVRYRIDGVLHTTNVKAEIRRFQAAIISRIKILANLNIAEKRLPQDGSFKIKTQGREIDIRVSIVPTAMGEGVVMRILDRESLKLSLRDLGMSDDICENFESLITRPHGIILVTGPTGAGKTTTLYAALNTIVSDKIKILTVEDPVEYVLPGVNQVQVNPKIGLTFAMALRAFLRHDPDVVLVGEIRDEETATVAINASLTGHLVFSTLHTNDAAGATTRLLDMGIEPFLVSSSVEGILAQRLVRTVCKHCRYEIKPEADTVPSDLELPGDAELVMGRGCRECRYSGYSGRLGLFELIMLDDEIREMIVQQKSAGMILKNCVERGLRVMREDGWDKVRAGRTTIEEVLRVTKV